MTQSFPNGYVFISYAHKDAAIRQRILDSLRQHGMPVWIDAENLQPGTPNWERNIENAIRGCGAVAVLLSPAASASDWVRHEVTYADYHRKSIIPVLVDGGIESSVPIRLINYQLVNMTQDWNSGIAQLATALKSYSQSELEKMKAEAEVAARDEAARQAAIKAAEEMAVREAAERIAREKAEHLREERNREAAIRAVQEEERRLAAEKIAKEKAERQAAEAAKLKAALEEATREDNEDWKTNDDRLWVALSYIFTPFVPIIILLMEEKRNRPFIRAHNAQALGIGIISLLISILLSWTIILAFVPLIIFVFQIVWGIQAYNGKYIEIPALTKFVKNQGWV
jgi:uncharacterized membrane protein